MDRIVLGLSEKIILNNKELIAKIDTGAKGNSICETIIKDLNIPYIEKKIWVKSSNGRQLRRMVEAEIKIKDKTFTTTFNVTDRTHLKFPVLIGVQTLKEGFLVDPSINQYIDYSKHPELYTK
ncbi:MAG: RimK/LysX family protein [archaeon]